MVDSPSVMHELVLVFFRVPVSPSVLSRPVLQGPAREGGDRRPCDCQEWVC